MSVAITTAGGTEMRTPGKRFTIRRVRSRCRTNARPRALPPSEPAPIRRKLDCARLEGVSLEIADQDFVLLAAVIVDRLDQIAAQMLGTVEVRDLARAQLGGQGELGARHQPVREVIALRVIHHAVGGNRLQLFLEFVQIRGPAHFVLVGHAENEIAESERVGQDAPQIFQQRGRTLAQERIAFGLCPRAKLCAAGLQHHRHIRSETLAPCAPVRIRLPG